MPTNLTAILRKLGTISCIVSLLTITPHVVFATNLDDPDSNTDQYYSSGPLWTGLYFGASAGYGWGNSEQTYIRNNNHGLASTSPTGLNGAISAGYNHQLFGGVVLGAEIDLGILDMSDDDKIVYDGHIYKTSFGPWWASARLRAGYTFDRTMIYATGGAAWMKLTDISIGDAAGQSAYNKDTRSGWVYGAGIEHAFTDRVSAKVEYLHFDFGKYSGYSNNQEPFSFSNDMDLIRVGLNYKY